MKKETKIIVGLGVVVLAYYLWYNSKTSSFSNARGSGYKQTRLCCYTARSGRQKCNRVELVNGKCPQGYDQ